MPSTVCYLSTFVLSCVLPESAVHIQLSCEELRTMPWDTLPSSLSVFTQMAKLIRDKQHYEAPLFPLLLQASSPVRVGEGGI